MPDRIPADDEFTTTARSYLTRLEHQPLPHRLGENAMNFALTRRRRFTLAGLVIGAVLLTGAATTTVVALALHQPSLAPAPAPATTATPSPIVPTPTPRPTATPSPIVPTFAPSPTTAPTANPTAGWQTVTNHSGKFSVRHPASLQVQSCDPGSATGLNVDVTYLGPQVTANACSQHEGFPAAMLFESQPSSSPLSIPGACGGTVSSSPVRVAGVAGTRTVNGPSGTPCVGGAGQSDVFYTFTTNGRNYLFQFHRAAGDPDLTATFDLMVQSVSFS